MRSTSREISRWVSWRWQSESLRWFVVIVPDFEGRRDGGGRRGRREVKEEKWEGGG